MISGTAFDKLKYHIMMLMNIKSGIIPTTPYSQLHPASQKRFKQELKAYLETATEARILHDFERYFKDDIIIQLMKTNTERYDYGSLSNALGDEKINRFRFVYPTKMPSESYIS
jgi:hypothetical protein